MSAHDDSTSSASSAPAVPPPVPAYKQKRQKRRKKKSPYARLIADAKRGSDQKVDSTPKELQVATGVFKKIDKI